MSFGVSIGDILKLCELAGRVYKNCRDCTGEYQSMTSEARNLTNLLEDIGDKFDKIPENKQQQLSDAYDTCVSVLEELDKVLVHYNGLDTKSKRVWDRLKWDQDKSRSIRERLTSSVVMLSSFYTSLIHDNQVLILEALNRLENDYRGGHREESVASVEMIASGAAQDEAEDDAAAWRQIFRDLEDVGISQQIALSYREFIVDWFVRAVNEGRLIDQQVESPYLASMPQDIASALPVLAPVAPRTTFRGGSLDLPLTYESAQPTATSNPSDYDKPAASNDIFQSPASSPVIDPSSNVLDDPRPLAPIESNSSTYEHILSHSSSQGLPDETHVDQQPIMPSAPSADGSPIMPIDGYFAVKAELIMAAWAKRDFPAVEEYLESLLRAVEQGQMTMIFDRNTQPDRRVLRHLIGVCASYSGSYHKAKAFFESAFNGIYLNGRHLDEGDIAAARWLGDVCLLLHEPRNAALAWGVALEGLIARYGLSHTFTRRVYDELRLLGICLHALEHHEGKPQQHTDNLDIFQNSHAKEKASLLESVRGRMLQMHTHANRDLTYLLSNGSKSPRPRTERMLSEEVLVEPLASLSSWPLQWDSTFLPAGAILLQQRMTVPPSKYNSISLPNRALPVVGFGKSKSLHYVTKKSSKWLIDTLIAGLRRNGIKYGEQDVSIVCRLEQNVNDLSFEIGMEIKFMKSRFSNMHGLLITEAQWATRGIPTSTDATGDLKIPRDTEMFRKLVKDIMQKAEKEEVSSQAAGVGRDSFVSGSPAILKKRSTYG